ncbi:MAG: hypothetical protein WCF04_07735, partial [Candidatus Nanopelagicales bacterium]
MPATATTGSSKTTGPSRPRAAGGNGSLHVHPQPGTRADRFPDRRLRDCLDPEAAPWETGLDAEAAVLGDG